jgi:U4/U6.U5 tri-snRNP-associated protein 3
VWTTPPTLNISYHHVLLIANNFFFDRDIIHHSCVTREGFILLHIRIMETRKLKRYDSPPPSHSRGLDSPSDRRRSRSPDERRERRERPYGKRDRVELQNDNYQYRKQNYDRNYERDTEGRGERFRERHRREYEHRDYDRDNMEADRSYRNRGYEDKYYDKEYRERDRDYRGREYGEERRSRPERDSWSEHKRQNSSDSNNQRIDKDTDNYKQSKEVANGKEASSDNSEAPEVADSSVLMQQMMGFSGFNSSKGKKVAGTDVGGVARSKNSTYRQYMNRSGGFNRELSPPPE